MQEKNIITANIPNNAITLKRFIEQKRLLKTKLKLIHIQLLDEDIKQLEQENLTLLSLNLEDLYLTRNMHLIAPIENKIVPATDNNLKLQTYLIYLSYLYNLNLIKLYQSDPHLLWNLIQSLQISMHIKQSFYTLLKENKGDYFSTYLEELNSPLYRIKQQEDILTLKKCQPNI